MYILLATLHSVKIQKEIVAAQTIDKREHQSAPITLKGTLNAMLRFIVATQKHKILYAIGSQRGLIALVAKLPFDALQDGELGSLMMMSLILMSFDNIECLALLRENISSTWLLSFLKEYIDSKTSTEQSSLLDSIFPSTVWPIAIRFYESN